MNRRVPLVPILLLMVPWFFLSAYLWHILWTIGGINLVAVFFALLIYALLFWLIWRLVDCLNIFDD